MNFDEYRDKLNEFNSRPQYRKEMLNLIKLMDPQPHELILDYGAGTGMMAQHIRTVSEATAYAYDIHDQYYESDPFYFKRQLHFHLDKIYFMHSFAHIEDPKQTLELLRDKFLKNYGQIFILTPNRDYITTHEPPKGYKPDPTVHKHYSPAEIMRLFLMTDAAKFTIHSRPDDERIIASATYNTLTT